MPSKDMFVCDLCLQEYMDVLKIEQKPQYREEKCGFCGKKKLCKWSRIHYGQKR